MTFNIKMLLHHGWMMWILLGIVVLQVPLTSAAPDLTLPAADFTLDGTNPIAIKGVATTLKFNLKIRNDAATATLPNNIAGSATPNYALNFYFSQVNNIDQSAVTKTALTIVGTPPSLNFLLNGAASSATLAFETTATLPSAACNLFKWLCACVSIPIAQMGYTETPTNNNCACRDATNKISCNPDPTPVTPATVAVTAITTSAATLLWGPVTGTFQTYEISISPTTGGAKADPASVTKGTTTTALKDLTPGTEYTVTVTTKDGTQLSSGADKTFRTKPAAVGTINIASTTTNSAKASWTKVAGVVTSYTASINDPTSAGTPKVNPSTVTTLSAPATDLTGLVPGVEYTLSITTVSNGVLSSVVTKTFRTKPHPPDASKISVPTGTITTTTAKVSWEKVTTGVFDTYSSSASPAATITPTSVASTEQSPSVDLSALSAGTEYTITLKTVSGGVESDAVTKTFKTKPPTPGSITVESVEMISAKGKWTKPATGTYGTFTNYNITVTPKESGVATPTVTPSTVLSSEAAPSVDITGLVAGEVYTVSVIATWDGVEGTASTKEFRTKPKQVTGIQIDNLATTTATVRWTALTLPAKYTSLYKYDVDIVQTGPSVAPSQVAHPGTSTGVTGMTPGTTYKVKVTTVAGTGLLVMNSDPAEHEFTAKPAPVSGSITFGSVTTKTADATWTKVSLGAGTGYKLSISPTGPTMTPNPVPWATDPPKASLTNLIPGTLYTLTVTSMSGTTEGDPTTGTVRAKPTPVDVNKVTVSSITTTSASISWPAITEGVLTSFTVTLDEAGTVTPSSVTNLVNPSVQLTGLMKGTKYIATIVTNSAEGKSGPVTKEFYTKPDQASNIKVLSFDTTTAVITWDKTGTGGVDSYNINASPSGVTIIPSHVLAFTNLQTSLIDMKPGVQYTVTITARAGTQTNPATKQFWTKPLPVTGVTLTPNNDKITISWTAGVGSTQNQYKVRYRAVFANPTSTWVDATVTHPTLQKEISITPGEKYQVEVIAVSGGVESDKATGSLVTAPFPPSSPSVDKTAATTTSIKVRWKAPSPASYFIKYIIEYTKAGMTGAKTIIEAGASDREKTIPGLQAGVKYNVKMYTESKENKRSMTSADTMGTSKPNCDMKLTDLTTETNKLKAIYTASSLVFTHYKFVIANGPGPAIPPIAKGTTPRELTYTTGVNPGTKYTITATCVSNGVESAPITAAVSAVPSPITKVDPIIPWPHKVVMTVHKPTIGQVGQLLVSCSGPSKGQLNGCTNPQSSTFLFADTVNITYDKLDGHEFYNFTFKVVSNGKESAEYSKRVKTSQGRPGPASRFLATSLTATTVRLDWSTPVDPNGLVTKYVVSYTGNYKKDPSMKLPTDKATQIFDVDPNAATYSRTLTGLRGGYFYDFTLYGMTDYPGPGENTPTSVTMKTEAPPLRSGVTAPLKTDIMNETVITVEFTKAFNDSHGPILYYSVIVAENKDNVTLSDASIAEDEIKTWHQVKNITESWPPYMAIRHCNIFDTSLNCEQAPGANRRRLLAVSGDTVQIRIGIQECGKVSGTGFCNGPLKPGTHYQVRLRGYTGPGLYKDTEYSHRISTAALYSATAKPTGKPDVGAIAGGTVAAVVMVIAIVVVVVVVIKKRKQDRAAEETTSPWVAGGHEEVENQGFVEIYDEIVPLPEREPESPLMSVVDRLLPNIGQEKRTTLKVVLAGLGVEQIKHLLFVEAKDLSPPLTTIEARMFINQLQEEEKRGGLDEGVYVDADYVQPGDQNDHHYVNQPRPEYVNVPAHNANAAANNDDVNAYAALEPHVQPAPSTYAALGGIHRR